MIKKKKNREKRILQLSFSEHYTRYASTKNYIRYISYKFHT